MDTPPTHQRPRRPAPRRHYSLWRLLRANLYDLSLLVRDSSLALIAFALLLLGGMLYFHFAYNFRLSVSLYESFKLLFFLSGLSLPTDPLGEVLFFLVPIVGLALIIQSVLNFGRLLLDKGSRREAWQVALASTYRHHIIVCGLGHVGMRVVHQLVAAGAEVVVIERDWASEFVQRVLALKVPVVVGDAREPATLRQAGLRRAAAVIAAINDDLLNVEIALTARAGHPGVRVVVRVFNEELDRNLERHLGANAAFSTSALAAPTLAAATISSQIDYVLSLEESGELLGMTSLVVLPETFLPKVLQDLEQHYGVRVLAAQNAAGRALERQPDVPIAPGLRLQVLGPLAALEALHNRNTAGTATTHLAPGESGRLTPQKDTVIICGLGKVGYRVVQRLHRLSQRPHIVVVHLEDAQSTFARHIHQLHGIKEVIGDARDEQVLRQAGIERAAAIAALTSDDLTNLQIGLAARRLRPDVHPVLRVFSDVLAEKLTDLFGIATTYSTSALAGPTLAAAGMLSAIHQGVVIGDQLLALDQMSVRAGDHLHGASVAALEREQHALVVHLRRQSENTLLPPPDFILAPDDRLLLLAPIEVLARLRDAAGG